jgi:dipeptidase E
VLEALRQAGVPYLAASAGANLACPTIRTTNDMPIVEPGSLAALGLIPFQLNPHYLDPDPRSAHQGETRPKRIEEPIRAFACRSLRTRIARAYGTVMRRVTCT